MHRAEALEAQPRIHRLSIALTSLPNELCILQRQFSKYSAERAPSPRLYPQSSRLLAALHSTLTPDTEGWVLGRAGRH